MIRWALSLPFWVAAQVLAWMRWDHLGVCYLIIARTICTRYDLP